MEVHDHTVFREIAWLLGAAAAGLLGAALRQPVIVCLIAGTASRIRSLASLCVALLRFPVGLELDGRVVGTLGPVVVPATGLGQVAFTGWR